MFHFSFRKFFSFRFILFGFHGLILAILLPCSTCNNLPLETTHNALLTSRGASVLLVGLLLLDPQSFLAKRCRVSGFLDPPGYPKILFFFVEKFHIF